MRAAVKRYDPYVVHHLVQDDHIVRRLEQLDVLVVATGGDDRRSRREPHDASLCDAAVFRTIGSDPATPVPHRALTRHVCIDLPDLPYCRVKPIPS